MARNRTSPVLVIMFIVMLASCALAAYLFSLYPEH